MTRLELVQAAGDWVRVRRPVRREVGARGLVEVHFGLGRATRRGHQAARAGHKYAGRDKVGTISSPQVD